MPSSLWGKFHDHYEVSDQGIVRMVGRYVTRSDGVRRWFGPRILPQRLTRNGYVVVDITTLTPTGHVEITNTRMVHRIVAETFLPRTRACFVEVNHKDCDKRNNSTKNLEWVTSSENKLHAIANGRYAVGEHSHFAKLSDRDARIIYVLRNRYKYKLTDLADRFEVSFQSISRIAKGGHHAVKSGV